MRAARAACLLLLLAQALAAACGGDDDGAGGGPGAPLKVMTRNLYLGADLTLVVGDGSVMAPEVPARVVRFWETVLATDYPERAKLLADEIAAAKPDLVGLQEAVTYRRQEPGDFSFTAPQQNATEVVWDFVALLMNQLAARGAAYRVAVELPLSDAELPGTTADGKTFDLRLTDRDVILARDGTETANPRAVRFALFVPVPVGGARIPMVRGYTSVEATVGGRRLTFVNSHLEVGGGPLGAFQEGQARELVQALQPIAGPVVLVGDFNSAADGTGTMSYRLLTQSFADAWSKTRAGEPGFTCCSGDLKSATFAARTRIDLVLFRGKGLRAEATEIVGGDPARRTPGGLWPSDHLGVVGTLSLAP